MSPLRRLSGRVLRSRPFRDYSFMTLGILLTAWSLDVFLIPNKLAAGGVSGLATVLYYLARPSGLVLTVGIQILVMNVLLLAIGIRIRGWRYAAKTVYGAVGLAVAVDVLPLLNLTPHLAQNDYLLAALYGGAITGVGMGMVFKSGGNTGGTDIVAQLVTPLTSLGTGQVMFLADAVVTLFAAVVLGPQLALYGAVAVFVNGAVIDLILEGLSVDKAAWIVSEHSDAIGNAILYELQRGATGIQARGLYSGAEREMIFTVVTRRELDDLKRLVHAIDPTALLIISDVHETIGEGFKEPRVG